MKRTIAAAFAVLLLTSCGASDESEDSVSQSARIEESSSGVSEVTNTESGKITELESGLSAARFDGDYKFDKFLDEGGAESDAGVIAFLAKNLIGDAISELGADIFGCSAFSAKGEDGCYFGRNFDWYKCNALIVTAHPDSGYSSISTVNTAVA